MLQPRRGMCSQGRAVLHGYFPGSRDAIHVQLVLGVLSSACPLCEYCCGLQAPWGALLPAPGLSIANTWSGTTNPQGPLKTQQRHCKRLEEHCKHPGEHHCKMLGVALQIPEPHWKPRGTAANPQSGIANPGAWLQTIEAALQTSGHLCKTPERRCSSVPCNP